jgi:RNA polymerase sigma-70 factor (ECF subfamily)
MDRDMFEQIMNLHADSIYSFCYRLTMNRDIADELYQETMVKAFEEKDRIHKDQNPRSFMICIAIGNWKNIKRKEARRSHLAPVTSYDEKEVGYPLSGEVVEETILEQERSEILDRIFFYMDDKYRIPMILYYKYEYDLDSIAAICKKPKGTIKSRLHKGRQIVRDELMKARYYDEE